MHQALSTKHQILDWLQAVKDPEIPTISLIDLGVVRGVEIDEATGKVSVHLTPTFAGCPAMDYMKRDVERTLLAHGVPAVEVDISLREAWTSDMITDAGRAALRQHKLSPPPVLGNTVFDNRNRLPFFAPNGFPPGANPPFESYGKAASSYIIDGSGRGCPSSC